MPAYELSVLIAELARAGTRKIEHTLPLGQCQAYQRGKPQSQTSELNT
jgi:hypothetical protein